VRRGTTALAWGHRHGARKTALQPRTPENLRKIPSCHTLSPACVWRRQAPPLCWRALRRPTNDTKGNIKRVIRTCPLRSRPL
jgi:hypothetical protein